MLPLLLLLLPLYPELDGAADGDDGVLLGCAEQQDRRLNFTSRPFLLLCCLPCCSGVVVGLPEGYKAPAQQLCIEMFMHEFSVDRGLGVL
jgi:hypothetical protein